MQIILLDNPKDKLAVWRALEVHLSYLHDINETIDIIIPDKYMSDLNLYWSNSFKPDKITPYSSILMLGSIIRKFKNEKFFCITVKEVLLVKLFNPFHSTGIYFWVQGIIPEEDFLRTKSLYRKIKFSIAERIALKSAGKHILVSEYMKEYLELSRKIRFKKYIIIPCTSDLVYTKCERINDSYVYIGGLSTWQKIDDMLIIFRSIIMLNIDSKLFLITQDVTNMEKLVSEFIPDKFRENVRIFSLYDRNEIAQWLSKMEYGFLIRDNDPINNVSSPIKFAEYLSCGVNVIISDSVYSYAKYIGEFGCGISIHDHFDEKRFLNHTYDEKKAFKLYNELFDRNILLNRYKTLLEN